VIGHVPRKYSDKIWKEFKDACNHYFDKVKEQKHEENTGAAFDSKKSLLGNVERIFDREITKLI
jgi:hypothetical protein